MLIYGVANPAGEHGNYNGLYLRDLEIDDMIKKGSLKGKPVKIEHRGVDIGKIISAFKDEKRQLVCVIEVNDNEIEGAIAQEWIKDSTIKDLSLGYTVDIDKQADRLKAVGKNVLEVSLVKKGAREHCHIYKDEEWQQGKLPDREKQPASGSIPVNPEGALREESKTEEPFSEGPKKEELRAEEPAAKRARLDDWKLILGDAI